MDADAIRFLGRVMFGAGVGLPGWVAVEPQCETAAMFVSAVLLLVGAWLGWRP